MSDQAIDPAAAATTTQEIDEPAADQVPESPGEQVPADGPAEDLVPVEAANGSEAENGRDKVVGNEAAISGGEPEIVAEGSDESIGVERIQSDQIAVIDATAGDAVPTFEQSLEGEDARVDGTAMPKNLENSPKHPAAPPSQGTVAETRPERIEPRRQPDRPRDPNGHDEQPAPAPRNEGERPPASAPADDEEFSPTFEDLGLSGPLLKSLKDVGYEEPTPIQVRVIPSLLQGNDVIAQAQTGSGKTAAFGLPIIESIDSRVRRPQALILCPTRELAIQVSEALHKYGRHKEVETLPIYGGQPYERQFRGLQRGVQIVVGTPGRVMDHMRRNTLVLDDLRFFVLDEADEMLDMGFIEDIEWILEQVPGERQTALFSATIPQRIADLARRHMRQPERITIAGKEMTVPLTHQVSYEVPRARKVDALTRILDAETPTSAMIFGRTKNGVDELGESLMARGYGVETLHGDLSQAQRDRVMRRFRSGQADILIATDVAARGLDIPDVSHVFNYDVPDSAEAYVHRIGRTGRAGRTGMAITLITPRETRWLRQIERTTRARIEPRRLPTLADVAERRRELLKEQVVAVLGDEETYAQYLDSINDLADEHDLSAVAAALLKLYADETGRAMTPEQQEDDLAMLGAAVGPGAGRGPRGEAGMVRLVLQVGRNARVRPQDIVGAIANEAQIPGRAIGAIDILDGLTFVDIPQEFVDRVLASLKSVRIKGRYVNPEVARPDGGADRGGSGRGRGGGERGGRSDGGRGGYRGGPDRDGGGRQGGGPRDGGFDGQRRSDRSGAGGFDDGARGEGRPAPRSFDRDQRPSGPPRRDAPARRPPNVGGVRVGPWDEGTPNVPPQESGAQQPSDDRSRQNAGSGDHGPAPSKERGPARPRRFERTGPGTFKRRSDGRD